MTCPHCSRRLTRRQRADHRCSMCGRSFVFEPRDHASRVNDRRVLRAAGWLGENGRFRYTFEQLAAAVSRRAGLPPSFRVTLFAEWPRVHGSMPAGLIDPNERHRSRLPPGTATAQVLCPDSDVRICLLANDAETRFGITVVDAVIPGPEPVLVLDDKAASPDLRRDGRRVIDLGASACRTTLIRLRPSLLFTWLDLALTAEARFRDGARRAATVDFLNWPA